MEADTLRSRQERCSATRNQQKLAAEISKLNSQARTKTLEVRHLHTAKHINCCLIDQSLTTVQVQCLSSQLKLEQRRVKQLQKQLRLGQPALEPPSPISPPTASGQRRVSGERVHIMLCLISPPSGAPLDACNCKLEQHSPHVDDREMMAAVRIQAAYRGHRARIMHGKVNTSYTNRLFTIPTRFALPERALLLHMGKATKWYVGT